MLYILPGGVFHLRLHYSICIYIYVYIYIYIYQGFIQDFLLEGGNVFSHASTKHVNVGGSGASPPGNLFKT